MNAAYFIPIFLLLLIVITNQRNERDSAVKKLISKRKREDRKEMTELAKRFIGKECLIYVLGNSQIAGVVKEVEDGAILVENQGNTEAVNLDFIIRIREYPKNKNGKKKSVILD